MHGMSPATILSLIALLSMSLPLAAQTVSTRNYLKRPTTVSVQYMLRLPLKSDDVAEQEKVMETGRRRLYEIGAKECEAILATLASSCTLSSLNVQSNNYRQRNEDNFVTLTANAQYQIEVKSEDADQGSKER